MENNESVSIYSNNTANYNEFERDSLLLVLCVVLCSTLYIIFSCVVILALKRTKTVPSMARFLAISLLVCYALIAIIIVCRRVVDYKNKKIVIITLVTVAIRLTRYTIIAMLAIDRVIVIQFPFFYCRYQSSIKVRAVAVFFMCTISLWCLASYTWICNLTSTQGEFAELTCLKVKTPPFVASVIGITGVIVLTCFTIISKTLYKKSKDSHVRNITGIYKTTIAILGNAINFVAIVVIFSIIIFVFDSLQDAELTFEILTGLNALLDTALYAIWFKECRLELLKMATICVPKLEQKVERLRYQVFNITTTTNLSRVVTNTNRTSNF